MAKPLIVNLAGVDIPLELSKVERADLYGFIDIETLDEQGRKCHLATLADDGKTLIASSGTALVTLSIDGEWLDKKKLTPTDPEGKTITHVPSSYAAPVPLTKTVSVEDYLTHNIRSVYQIAGDLGPLLPELKKGVIFQFPYSFRGGLEPDAGFLLLAADDTPFLAVGSPTKLDFIGLETTAPVTEEETDTSEDDDALDFNMM